MTQLSELQKGMLVGMLRAGKSIRWTAERMHRSKRTVEKWWNRWRQDHNCRRQRGSGRPKKTTIAQDRKLLLATKRSRFASTAKLYHSWRQACGIDVSLRTAKRRVFKAKYKSRQPAVRIPLTPVHRRNRLAWANDHRLWDIEWADILWTDESRFKVDFCDKRIRVRRQVNERFADCCIAEHDRYGKGSAMFWGGIWIGGRTDLVLIDGNLNGERYLNEIINPVVIPTIREHHLTFQQDHARPHDAAIVRRALETADIGTLAWPSCSPDLSPIEQVWDLLGNAVYRSDAVPTTLPELTRSVLAAWENLDQATIDHIIYSVPNRIEQCIAKRGGHTKY